MTVPDVMFAGFQLTHLESARTCLEALLSALLEKMQEIEGKLRPFRQVLSRCITSLPNEILAKIIHFSATDLATTRDLSQVSRRFRSMTLQSQRLWASVSSVMSRSWINAFLARSGTTGLCVDFVFPMQGIEVNNWDKFLQAVASESHRWHELSLCYPFGHDDKYDEIWRQLSGSDPQALRRLRIAGPAFGNPPPFRSHFYRSWSIPNLRDLEVVEIIPMPFANAITRLQLIITNSETLGNWASLLSFLDSIPTLVNLTLMLTWKLGTPNSSPRLVLPNVESMDLAVLTMVRGNATAFAELLTVPCFGATLFCPKLNSLNLSITLNTPSNQNEPWPRKDIMTSHLLDILTPNGFPSLTDLRLVTSLLPKAPDLSFSIPFGRIGRLKRLHLQTSQDILIEVPCEGVELAGVEDVVPPLEVLELSGCDSSANNWILAFMTARKSRPDWDKFKRLSIENCSGIESERLRLIVPPEKLEWVC